MTIRLNERKYPLNFLFKCKDCETMSKQNYRSLISIDIFPNKSSSHATSKKKKT